MENTLPRPDQWTPEEMMQVRQVGKVQVAPDGRRVLYTVTTAVMNPEKSAYLTHIYVADADGAHPFQLTFGDHSAILPQWSPDGECIAFVSERSGKNEIYLIQVECGEARQLTAAETGVGNFKWSPDGRLIAFTMPDLATEEEKNAQKSGDDARTVDRDFAMNHLWLAPVTPNDGAPNAPRRLTRGNFNVDPACPEGFNWSPDGQKIAFTHTPTPQQGSLWPLYGDLSTVDVESGHMAELVRSTDSAFSPLYSPDGEWLAYALVEKPTCPGIPSAAPS